MCIRDRAEVVDNRTVIGEGLGAHAGRPEADLVAADRREVALQLADVGPLREVSPHLRHTHPPVADRESLEPAVGERAGEVAQVEVGAPVALAGEGEDGVRTCLLYTSDAADDLTRVDLGGR